MIEGAGHAQHVVPRAQARLDKRTVLLRRLVFLIPGTLFFLMLFVPTAYRSLKGVLLLVVLVGVAAPVFETGRVFLHRSVVRWTLLMVLTGLAGIGIGVLNGAPGAVRVSTVYVIWPVLYTLMVSGVRRRSTVEGLMKVLVWATVAIGLYSLSFILHAAGWWPDWLYVKLDQGQLIGFYPGFMEFDLYSISSLVFLVPFSLAALLAWRHLTKPPVSRRLLWFALLVGLLVSFLTGRRALWLIVALSPLVALAFYVFVPHRSLRTVVIIATSTGLGLLVVYISLSTFYDFRISAVFDLFRAGFDFENDFGGILRKEQFGALLRGWLTSPLWGAGHGASAEAFGSVRAIDQSWSYELSYMALLFQTGLLGFLIYSAGVLWIYRMGLRFIRSGSSLGLYMLPVLAGMTCFLIANATNPYLGKFDCLWVIFLPIALINYGLLNSNAR